MSCSLYCVTSVLRYIFSSMFTSNIRDNFSKNFSNLNHIHIKKCIYVYIWARAGERCPWGRKGQYIGQSDGQLGAGWTAWTYVYIKSSGVNYRRCL